MYMYVYKLHVVKGTEIYLFIFIYLFHFPGYTLYMSQHCTQIIMIIINNKGKKGNLKLQINKNKNNIQLAPVGLPKRN